MCHQIHECSIFFLFFLIHRPIMQLQLKIRDFCLETNVNISTINKNKNNKVNHISRFKYLWADFDRITQNYF